MVIKRKPITFYADEDVQGWYDSLGYGEGTRKINEMLRASLTGLSSARKAHKGAKQPFHLTFSFGQMQTLLKQLENAHKLYDDSNADPEDEGYNEAKAEERELAKLIGYITDAL